MFRSEDSTLSWTATTESRAADGSSSGAAVTKQIRRDIGMVNRGWAGLLGNARSRSMVSASLCLSSFCAERHGLVCEASTLYNSSERYKMLDGAAMECAGSVARKHALGDNLKAVKPFQYGYRFQVFSLSVQTLW